MHSPYTHTCPIRQAASQPPQCASSLPASTQRSPHSVCSAAQSGTHAPATHATPGAHACSHDPQCAGSICRSLQSSPHATELAPHATPQLPITHDSPAPHPTPHPPQCIGSCIGSTHPPSHIASGAPHPVGSTPSVVGSGVSPDPSVKPIDVGAASLAPPVVAADATLSPVDSPASPASPQPQSAAITPTHTTRPHRSLRIPPLSDPRRPAASRYYRAMPGCHVLHDYPRRAHLEFYRRYPDPFYSVTFELELGHLRSRLRAAGFSTYAGMCWAFHAALQSIDAFRVRLDGDQVVQHDALRLGLTVPAPRRTFSFTTLDWHPDPAVFFPAAAAAMARASQRAQLGDGDAPDYAYYTALPRVPFTGFTHVRLPDPTAGQPEIAFGKLREDGPRTLVPVGVQVNHLFVDGVDLGDLHDAAAEAFARAF